jgi:hypothetical protein
MNPRIKHISFPRTRPPPVIVRDVVAVFRACESEVSTIELSKGLTSNEVLAILRAPLSSIGFQVEEGKKKDEKIARPVFFGEDGAPSLLYEVDAYHSSARCGLEVEAGRALLGGAVYRDLVQAMVMVDVDHLIIAVPNAYKYQSSGKQLTNDDYSSSAAIAEALYGHDRVRMPFGLTVVGY